MENLDINNPEFTDYSKKQIEQLQREAENRKRWRQQINDDPRIQAHLETMLPKIRTAFIDFYLAQKNMWVENNDYYEKLKSTEGIEWIDDATSHLKLIQQKKLFDKQCLWRAEQITIEGVELCIDFQVWQYNILNCPFITPVSQGDIDCYIDYLLHTKEDPEVQLWHNWQAFESLKTAWQNGADAKPGTGFPDWYHYKNTITNEDDLMLLEDVRGAKEKFYTTLCLEGMQAMQVKDQTELPPKDEVLKVFEKPYVEWFVNEYESKDIRD